MADLFPEEDDTLDLPSAAQAQAPEALRRHADMAFLEDHRLSPFAYLLGWAGLLPQLWVLMLLVGRDPDVQDFARLMAQAYAALILSFLGGIWWGMSARVAGEPPRWLWFAAVLPALVAYATFLPMAMGARDTALPCVILATALVATLWVDWRLCADGIAPRGWMLLRLPLSVGLALLTLLTAVF